jgi:hypothetical protein
VREPVANPRWRRSAGPPTGGVSLACLLVWLADTMNCRLTVAIYDALCIDGGAREGDFCG